MMDINGRQVKWRGKPIESLTKSELTEALIQALEHIQRTQGFPDYFGL